MNNIKKSNKRTKEQKYCSCLMKVRGNTYKKTRKVISPYGICTNSLYNRQKEKRNKLIRCSGYYDFKKYDIDYLRAYALEKKIKIKNKYNKFYSKSELVKKLNLYKKKK